MIISLLFLLVLTFLDQDFLTESVVLYGTALLFYGINFFNNVLFFFFFYKQYKTITDHKLGCK